MNCPHCGEPLQDNWLVDPQDFVFYDGMTFCTGECRDMWRDEE